MKLVIGNLYKFGSEETIICLLKFKILKNKFNGLTLCYVLGTNSPHLMNKNKEAVGQSRLVKLIYNNLTSSENVFNTKDIPTHK